MEGRGQRGNPVTVDLQRTGQQDIPKVGARGASFIAGTSYITTHSQSTDAELKSWTGDGHINDCYKDKEEKRKTGHQGYMDGG